MSPKNFGGRILNKAWNTYANDLPKFTMHSTIAGWILAVASNVFGVATDKKIDTKEKKYLIPREIGDGVANILLFLCITSPMTKFVNKLVDQGKIGVKQGVDLGKLGIDQSILKGGLGVGASLLGAVVVSNILAPIIRNVFAARSQKKFLQKQNNAPIENTIPSVQPVQNNIKQTPYMQTFLTAIHSGNLKV